MVDEILLIFTHKQKPVADAYLETVASSELRKYRSVSQYGVREGQDLYSHLVCGGLRLHALSSLFDFSALETRLLMSAFSIHDLNKLYEPGGKGLRQLADDRAFLAQVIHESGVSRFFPEWEDYLVDMKQLILGHGGHSTVAGEQLLAHIPGSRIDKERLRELTHLMRATDVADLSKTFEERAFKDKFILELNSVGIKQFRLISHRLGEHRGIFSNIIHNSVSKILENEHNATPAFLYPEGTWYLVDSKTPLPEHAIFYQHVRHDVRQALHGVRSQDLSKIVVLTKDGVKVDASLFALGLDAEKIVNAITKQVFRRRFTPRNIESNQQKCATRLERKIDTDYSSYLSAHQLRYPESEEGMRTGELIRALYNLVNVHFKTEAAALTEGQTDPWQAIYRFLGVNGDTLEPFDRLYDRPFILAGTLQFTYLVLEERVVEIVCQLLEEGGVSPEERPTAADDYLTGYIADTLEGDFLPRPAVDFSTYFNAYTGRNHRQCCYSAFTGNAESWMKPEVPEGISVQQFSNRLEGGVRRDPKRNVCSVCREQFFLEQMLFHSGGTKGMYLHFFPDGGLPGDYLAAVKHTLDSMARQADPNTFFLPTEKSLIEAEVDERTLHLVRQKALGFAVPRRSEAIGNVITLSVCPGWDTSADGKKKELPVGKRVLLSVEIGLRLAQFLGLRCLVSESPIPPLIPEDFLYVDSLPIALQSFLSGRTCDRAGAEALLQRFRALRLVDQEVRIRYDSLIWDLARSLDANPLEIFAVADRALERKLRQESSSRRDNLGFTIRARICQALVQLAEGDTFMNDSQSLSARVKKIAGLATEHKIWGRSRIRRNSLLSPLNITFGNLRRMTPEMDLSFVHAQTIQDIFDHIDRVRTQESPQFRLGATKRQAITSYVNEFFGIVEDIYQERLPKLFTQEKAFKAAYLCFLSEAMRAQNVEPLDEEPEEHDSETDNPS